MRSIITVIVVILALSSALQAQDFVWTGWFGPPESNSAWGHSWASAGNTFSNGWGHTWYWSDDAIPHYPSVSDDVLIPEGVILDIEGGAFAYAASLTVSEGAQLLMPQSNVTIHGPILTNNGHIHAWGITALGGGLVLNESLEMTGQGDLFLDFALINSWQPEATLIVGAGQTIYGTGKLGWEPYGNYHGLALTNHGVIRADGDTNQLDIFGTEVVNLGLVHAVDASLLRIWGNWDNSGGEIAATGTSTVRLCNMTDHGAHVRGGLLRTEGDAQFQLQGNACVQDVTLDGLLHIPRWENGHMAGVITNNGVINQGFYGGGGSAVVYVDSALTFLGDGELRIGSGNTLKMTVWPDHQAVVTNGADHTIVSQGGYLGENPNYYGDQRVALVNHGTIVCQDAVYNNEFRTTSFTNHGTLVIEPTASTTTQLWGLYSQSTGRLDCDDVLQSNDGGFAFSGGVLAGAGGLQGNVSLGGAAVVHPGDEGEIGTLDIWGNLTLTGGGTLVCEWSNDEKDRLAVHGNIAATGNMALRVEFLSIVDPAKSADYILITCAEVDDQATWSLELPDGWTYDELVWVDNALVVQGLSGMPTDVPDDLPAATALHGAAPNPFNPTTSLRFALDQPGPVRLWVSDVAGRHVRTLIDERRSAGQHSVIWDGRDQDGRGVGSGTYLCVMEAGGERRMQRMSLVR